MKKKPVEPTYESCQLFATLGKVYSLSDIHGNVFYVGCTIARLEERLGSHITEARRANPDRPVLTRKCRHIIQLNYQISATIIEAVWLTARSRGELQSKLRSYEKNWIVKYRKLGYDLTNTEYLNILEVIQSEEYVGKTITVTNGQMTIDPKFSSNEPAESRVQIEA